MKTLVIHPKDPTTDFLKEIYKNKDWTIINHNPSKSELKKAIKDHDRVIMLGHGTGYGLLGFGRFVIDSRLVYLLREKDCVCIWCNADKFISKYKLKGFYTGMIISEYEEAIDYCIQAFNLIHITESNILFAEAVKESILEEDILKGIKERYKTKNNPIILFNQNNLFINLESWNKEL